MNNEITFPQKIVAFLGYIIPLIGWWIPLYLAPKNQTLQYHGRQGFIITLTFLINAVFFYLLSRIIPIQFDGIVNILWIVLACVYAVVILTAGIKSLFCKKADLFLFGKIADILPL